MDKDQRHLQLLNRVTSGDKEAFKELYESTHEKVYYYLVRFVGRDRAEDMLIETFTQVWQKSSRFNGGSKVSTWMIAIARNLSLKEFRKNDRYRYYENLDPLLETDNGTNREVESRDRTKVLKEALAKLGSKQREVLELFFYHQMSYREIAKIVDIPINTVKTRIYYAKDRLTGVLEDMGVNHDQI